MEYKIDDVIEYETNVFDEWKCNPIFFKAIKYNNLYDRCCNFVENNKESKFFYVLGTNPNTIKVTESFLYYYLNEKINVVAVDVSDFFTEYRHISFSSRDYESPFLTPLKDVEVLIFTDVSNLINNVIYTFVEGFSSIIKYRFYNNKKTIIIWGSKETPNGMIKNLFDSCKGD